MSIVQNSDFKVGRFKIAGGTSIAPDSDRLGNKVELDQFIDEFEKECLILTLGYTLYAELVTNLDASEANGVKQGADQKWVDLVVGKDNYMGLKKVLVPYIYFMFLENDESSHSGVGVVKESGKQVRAYPERSKAVKAWREFYKHTIGNTVTPRAWIQESIFGNLTAYDWYGTSETGIKPLYTYLKDNAADFPDAVSTEFDNLNFYGI